MSPSRKIEDDQNMEDQFMKAQKKDVLTLLDFELKTLSKNAKVYQTHGNSNLFFIADRAKVHSEVKLQLSQLDCDNKKNTKKLS